MIGLTTRCDRYRALSVNRAVACDRRAVTVEIGDETGRDLMADGKPSLRRSETKDRAFKTGNENGWDRATGPNRSPSKTRPELAVGRGTVPRVPP